MKKDGVTDEELQDAGAVDDKDAQNGQTVTQTKTKAKRRLLAGLKNIQADAVGAKRIFGTDGKKRPYMRDITLADLLDPDTAGDIISRALMNLEILKVTENACRDADYAKAQAKKNKGKKQNGQSTNSKQTKDKTPRLKINEDNVPLAIIPEALVATGDFKILHEPLNDTLPSCRYLMRVYQDGQKTGLWKIIEIDAKNIPKEICKILTNMCGVLTQRQQCDYVNAIKSAFYSELPRATDNLRKFDNKVIPCKNGVFDKITGTPRFTEWTDLKQLEKIYGTDFAFTWCLRVNYNPDAKCPSYRDPFEIIESAFDMNTQVGQASNRIMVQSMQFAVRGTSGGTGHLIWLCNSGNCASGSNGKTTVMNLVKTLFTDGSRTPLICTANMADLFSGGFGSSQLMDAVVFMGDEQDKVLRDTDNFKNFVRNQEIAVNRKYMPEVMISCPGGKYQCLNETPQMANKNWAIYRGNIFLMFEKDYSEGSLERDPHLITDYVWQEDVAEYILARLCEMEFAEDYAEDDLADIEPNKWTVISDNDSSVEALPDLFNGLKPIYSIWKSTPEMVPAKIMYDLYKAWYNDHRSGNRQAMKSKRFYATANEMFKHCQLDYIYVKVKRKMTNNAKSSLQQPMEIMDDYGYTLYDTFTDYSRHDDVDNALEYHHIILSREAVSKEYTGYFFRRDYYEEHYLKDDADDTDDTDNANDTDDSNDVKTA